jgi:hypothetical protein
MKKHFYRKWILVAIAPMLLGASSAVTAQAASAKPVLKSIEPHEASIGQHLTLTGKGLDAPKGRVLVDGNAYLDVYLTLNPDRTIGFDLPRIMRPPFHQPTGEGTLIIHKRMRLVQLLPGEHTFAVETDDGTSNALNFTVLPFPGKAALDESSLQQSTGSPTLSGTAENLSAISLGIGVLDKPQSLRGGPTGYTLDRPIPVVNGRWSVDLQAASSPSYDVYRLCPLEPGRYRITVRDPKTLVNIPLPQSTLTITESAH